MVLACSVIKGEEADIGNKRIFLSCHLQTIFFASIRKYVIQILDIETLPFKSKSLNNNDSL